MDSLLPRFQDHVKTGLQFDLPREYHIRNGIAYLQGFSESAVCRQSEEELKGALRDVSQCLGYLLSLEASE